MKVVGFAGYSGSGKTTLVEQLIGELKRRGLRVSVIKHAHHTFDVDKEGKDSYRHREAGAFEVVVTSRKRFVLMREFEQDQELSVHHVLAEVWEGVDWVLVEGYKHSDILKIEVLRPSLKHPVLYEEDDFIVAMATDEMSALEGKTLRPVLDLNDAAQVAQWLVDNGERFEYKAENYA